MSFRSLAIPFLFLIASHLAASDVRLVKDIATGPDGRSSNPTELTPAGDLLFFFAFTETDGYELWKSDGTEQGTDLVLDSDVGWESDVPGTILGAAGDVVFFTTATGEPSYWRTDGTPAGTWPLDVVSGYWVWESGKSIRDALLFVQGSSTGFTLWRSDGSEEGTIPVATIPEPSTPVVSGDLYFFVAGQTLWRSDGTESGTFAVREADVRVTGEVLPASEGRVALTAADGIWISDGSAEGTRHVVKETAGAEALAVLGETVVFNLGTALWRSDGTPEGTVKLHENLKPERSGMLGGGVLFMSSGNPHLPGELWVTDGTAEGTRNLQPYFASELTPFAGRMFFVSRGQLWSSDGTPEGTQLVEALAPEQVNSHLGSLTVANGRLFFTLFSVPEMWEIAVTNGQPGGMRILNIHADVADSDPRGGISDGSLMYFTANDGVHGRETWITDGSDSGTRLFSDLTPGPESTVLWGFARLGDRGLLADSTSLWVSDGSPTGPTLLRSWGAAPREMVELGPFTVFRAPGVADETFTYWITDGTIEGTRLLETLTGGRHPSSVHVVAGRLLMQIDDELWTTDGTSDGTERLAVIGLGWDIVVAGERIFLVSKGSSEPKELRVLQGGDVTNVGTFDRYAAFWLGSIGDLLLFQGAPNELWRSDGTPAGTYRLGSFADLLPPGRTLIRSNDQFAWMLSDDGVHGIEPWVTDGTVAGTRLAGDIRPGPLSSVASYAPSGGVGGDSFFLAANDGVHGLEVWRIPGRSAPRLAADINPGGSGSDPKILGVIGNEILVRAFTRQTGMELFALPLETEIPARRRLAGR